MRTTFVVSKARKNISPLGLPAGMLYVRKIPKLAEVTVTKRVEAIKPSAAGFYPRFYDRDHDEDDDITVLSTVVDILFRR